MKDDDGIVSAFPAKLFDIINGKIPDNWVCQRKNDGSISLLPVLWAREYFWDDYYNDEFNAIRDFKEAEKKIIKDDN